MQTVPTPFTITTNVPSSFRPPIPLSPVSHSCVSAAGSAQGSLQRFMSSLPPHPIPSAVNIVGTGSQSGRSKLSGQGSVSSGHQVSEQGLSPATSRLASDRTVRMTFYHTVMPTAVAYTTVIETPSLRTKPRSYVTITTVVTAPES